ALLDNFCWGDPTRPETLGALLETARGCRDAALYFKAPFVSGKDSLNNEYLTAKGQRQSIPPTLLISAFGQIDDVSRAVTMDLKEPGKNLYLVGTIQGRQAEVASLPLYVVLHQAIQARLVRACHDLSEGGLAVAAAEMCIGGRLGLSITTEFDIFAETN